MFDQKDRRFPAQRVEKTGQPFRTFRPHAGHRLVEQKGLGLQCKRHGDFQLAAFAMGKLGGRKARAVGEPHPFENRHCRIDQ
ncbi:hypothetical protein D3C87_1469270 [compost metagenome]